MWQRAITGESRSVTQAPGGFRGARLRLCACPGRDLAGGADVGSLEAKVDAAKGEAGAIAEELRAAQGELAAAQQEAAAASAREERLSGLLAEGEERAAELRKRSSAPTTASRPSGGGCARAKAALARAPRRDL